MQALCLFPALAPWKGSLSLPGTWTPWVSLAGVCSVEAELLCRQLSLQLPAPTCSHLLGNSPSLPISLTNGAEWGLAKGEAEPPDLNLFCSWLQHLPSSLRAGRHFSGHSFFSGTQASSAKCWLAPKPPKPGFLAHFCAQRLLLPVPGWGNHLLLSSTLETLNFHGVCKML